MFDKAIIDLDSFMDLPVSAKALYFLLGMEADDEGFVSPRKVMRVHGGTEDDIKLLIAKGFLISFPSGVVVITDWNTNNWLDSRRIRPTIYVKERQSLGFTDDKKYVLSERLASVKPDEKSIEENTGKHSLQKFEIVKDEEVKPIREKKKSDVVFAIFKEELGRAPLNWRRNKTQIQAAENLLEERDVGQIRRALQFYKEKNDLPFCPQILSPWDLDRKWSQLIAFKKKNGN